MLQLSRLENHINIMKSTVFFRTDADNSIGFGHLSRCLVLAEVLREREGMAEFLIGGNDGNVKGIIASRGFVCHMLPHDSEFNSEISILEAFSSNDFNMIVLDMTHSRTLSDLNGFMMFIKKLHNRFKHIVVIDSLGEQALYHQVPDLSADIVIAPYVGVTHPRHKVPYRMLEGPEFCILDREYYNAPSRVVSDQAERIFITCGGSDPFGISLKALSAIEMIKDRGLEISIAIGPCFKEDLKLQILSLSRNSCHCVNVIDKPFNLAEHFKWCDLAIAASGLTKYELAATGTPAILLSIDREHAENNLPFASKGTSFALGVYDTVTVEDLAESVLMLLDDVEKRHIMAEKGQLLVDGRGAERVIKELEKLRDVKN